MTEARLTVALVGNPNAGKSTIFNAITGSRQHVGNYPGVTVECKEGQATHDGVNLTVVDLPGTYSLTAYSQEEIVTRDFLLDELPDVVIDIIDSSNLERNLYLATQLIELGVPLVLAFNMSDVARARGRSINVKMLSELLGVPIVRTIASKKRGIGGLLDAVITVARHPAEAVEKQRLCRYGSEVEPHVEQLVRQIGDGCSMDGHCRWYALKLLEGDDHTADRLRKNCPDAVEELLEQADGLRRHIRGICGDSAEIILADRRYGFISGACSESVRQSVEVRHERSDRIDAILTNRYLGLPIFAMLMYLVFQLTFAVGNPIVEYLDAGKTMLAQWVRQMGDADSLILSLLADGIIEGVGAVLVFLPLIMLLYVGISFLEDTGYMARAAFLLDKLMHRIGLHGKSFIPMLIGFGCTVPAVMATRILESRRDRLTTILVLPLMSCGARLPVYVLLLGAFFPSRTIIGLIQTGTYADGTPVYLLSMTNQALLLFAIYVTGIMLAVICAKVFRGTILRGEGTSFVMELPPYRLPAIKGLIVHMWERSREYIKKAGTIILAIVVILWALKTWPGLDADQHQVFENRRTAMQSQTGPTSQQIERQLRQIDFEEDRAQLMNSSVGRIGTSITPLLRPCGFDWKISTALLGAFAAKEVFIGQLGVIYAVGQDVDEQSETLQQKLRANYSPLQGLSIILFMLICSPCVATIAVTVRESGSWKWALLQWGYLTALAWVVATLVYQIGATVGWKTGLIG